MSVQEQKSTRRARGAPAAKPQSPAASDQAEVRSAERRSKIAVAAYFIAERRGFIPGHELDDWLAAEAEIENGELPSVMAAIEISATGRVS